MRMVFITISITLITLFSGCSKDSDIKKGDLSEVPAGGEVRAGRITVEDELIKGLKAEGDTGDYKIYNSKVQFILEDVGKSSGYGPYGGSIIDADLVRSNEGVGENTLLGEVFSVFNLRTINPTSIEVLNDGFDGNPAVVRVVGKDASLPIVDSVIQTTALPITITIDYTLEPDVNFLKIYTKIKNTSNKEINVSVMQGFLMGDGLRNFAPRFGFDSERIAGEVPFFANVGDSVGYGWFAEEDNADVLLYILNMLFVSMAEITLGPLEEKGFMSYMVVNDGDIESIYKEYYTLKGENSLAKLKGKVTEADGLTPIPRASVHLLNLDWELPDNYYSLSFTNEEGEYSFHVPPGRYEMIWTSKGREKVKGIDVDITEGAEIIRDITMDKGGRLAYEIRDNGGDLIPAKLTISFSGDDPSPPEAKLGEESFGGYADITLSYTGEGEISIKPGRYNVTVSRGVEYSIYTKENISIEPWGEINATIERVVDTFGYISGDFHVHTLNSPDSNDYLDLKVSALLVEGVEMPAITDHDYITDLNPTIDGMGAKDKIKAIVSEEITPVTLGHFNAFPMVLREDEPNKGAIQWYFKTVPEIFDIIREEHPGALIQLYHPRSPGYFDFVGYDPETGQADDPSNFSLDFDLIEVFNGTGWDQLQKTLLDWYSFLNRGKMVTAIGNSDNHDALHGSVGYPRNFVLVEEDIPGRVEVEEFITAIKAQRVVVSTGPFIDFHVEGAGVGDTVTNTDGVVSIYVRVQAPLWMGPMDTIDIIGNGEVIKTIALKEEEQEDSVIRYEGEILLESPATDTWYIIKVYGYGDMNPVVRARPMAFTNPIYVDVDGNGVFDPPYQFPGDL